ncbi:MAG: aldo/keto reductase [Polyangiaceae bacterium]|jgi:aryl-alcohol dehydrogenase-like predicted oxidoreductase
MQYTRLGATGLKVSRICLGCMSYGDPDKASPDGSRRWPWALREAEARPFFARALDVGINFFDTANVYSAGASEEVVGRALKDLARREDLVLATKVHGAMSPGPNGQGLSRKAIFQEIDASLRRLGTDYVDLYQIHRWDNETPIEETLQALDDVVRAGKVRYLGASSMHAWQFSKALHLAERNGWARFVSMQNHYNLLYREEEREMTALCRDQGIGMIPWSPLARGRLAQGATPSERTMRSQSDRFGKSLYGASADADALVLERLDAVAKARGVPNAQIALAWLLRQEGVAAPIVGATKLQQLDDAVASLSLKLSDDEARRLEEPYVPHSVAGFA